MPKNPVTTNWNPDYDNKPTGNVPRIRFSQKFSAKYLEKKNLILEIGCGIGSYTHLVDPIGPFALDLDINAIKIAKKYCTNSNFIVASALNLPFRKEIFDLICMWGVFEEIPEGTEEKIFRDIQRTLMSKGVLLLSVYSDNIITKFFDPAYIFRGVRHYNLQKFVKLITGLGLVIDECTVRGKLNTVISNFLVYFYKHILRKKEGMMKNYFDNKSNKEINSKEDGIVYIFIAAHKNG